MADPDWPMGFWGLIEGRDDPTFIWELTPTPSPTWAMTEEQEQAWWDAETTSTEDKAREFFFDEPLGEQYREVFARTTIRVGYRLSVAAMQRGYDPDLAWDLWFFDYLGEYLRTAPAQFDEEFDRDFVAAGGRINTAIGRGPFTPPLTISTLPSKH
ncbi:hypothetical protein HH308_09175 [Gordonia sp. TBRC 11910]|uniref:Uncharacterized protein n=1 Tax=Gordonia asplenii TaxID=2725283 RepID=A0A848KWZ3_9ACTN|nr:hypothetical protein [Gordonia asplenii]NMO01385.1 hypothetical protein [Gordonia asplenii]